MKIRIILLLATVTLVTASQSLSDMKLLKDGQMGKKQGNRVLSVNALQNGAKHKSFSIAKSRNCFFQFRFYDQTDAMIASMTVQSMSEFSDSKPGFIYGIEADNCDDGEYAGVSVINSKKLKFVQVFRSTNSSLIFYVNKKRYLDTGHIAPCSEWDKPIERFEIWERKKENEKRPCLSPQF